MSKTIDIYNDFLNMISAVGHLETFRSIYSNADEFMKINKHGRISCFSINIDKEFDLKKARLLTDPSLFEDEKQNIQNLCSKLIKNNTEKIIEKNLKNNSKAILLQMNEVNNKEYRQIYFCFIVISNKDFLEFDNYLIDFLKVHHNRINQLTEVKSLKKLSDTDEVTGLSNQRKLRRDLKYLVSDFQKSKESFSLLFIDIDRYKDVNDGYGHVVGTELLKQLGELLVKTIRETDLLYRYGGDEFVVILKDIDEETSDLVANRFLKTVCKHKFSSIGLDFFLSVSIGIASFPNHASTEKEILEIADKMMYEAKKNGRGIVCSAKDLI